MTALNSVTGRARAPILLRIFVVLTLSCTITMAQTAATSPSAETGVEGVILISPTRGGPARQGVLDSAPLRETNFSVRKGDETVASFKTDGEGKFRVPLAPGQYTVERAGGRGRIGRYGPFELEVVPGKMSKAQWICDSGLR